jgi:hypothetical protein
MASKLTERLIKKREVQNREEFDLFTRFDAASAKYKQTQQC